MAKIRLLEVLFRRAAFTPKKFIFSRIFCVNVVLLTLQTLFQRSPLHLESLSQESSHFLHSSHLSRHFQSFQSSLHYSFHLRYYFLHQTNIASCRHHRNLRELDRLGEMGQ